MQLRGCRDRVSDHTLLRTIQGRRLAIAGCAATVILLVLIGPGAVRPAGAGSLSIGAGSTMQLGDALVNMGCNYLIVEPGGTVLAQASTRSSVGVFDNRGTFAPGTGTVLLCGGAPPARGGGGPAPDRDPGLFVWHCHLLEHEDKGMMRPLELQA